MAKKRTKAGPDAAQEPTTNAPDRVTRYRFWHHRVRQAQKARKAWEERFGVEVLERFFLGEQQGSEVDKDAALVLNHFAASIDTDLPNLFYQDPKWFVRPTARSLPAVELRARHAESALEAVARQNQCLKRAGKLAVLQAYFRLGVIEAVYEPQFVGNPDKGKPILQQDTQGNVLHYPMVLPGAPMTDPAMGQPVQGPDGQPMMPEPTPHPMAGQPIPLMGPDGQPMLQEDRILKDDCFRFEWVDAAELLLDDGAGPDPAKWRWIGKEVVLPLEEAKKDPKFNANKRHLIGTETDRKRHPDAQPPPREREDEPEEQFVRLFVCYDIPARTTRVLADAQEFEDFLFEGDTTPGLEDHPFALLWYTPILGPEPSAWPKPMTADWRQPQEDYNKARWLVREHAERLLPKEVYDDNTFPGEEEQIKYTRGGVGVLAKVTDATKGPQPVTKPPMHDALVRIVPMLQSDWRIITGQTGTRLADPKANTATEAALAERAGNLRDSSKQDAINDWLALAGWKMLKLLRANMTFNMWVKLRGLSNQDVQTWLRQRGFEPAVVQGNPQVYNLIVQLLGQEKWEEIGQGDLDFDAEVLVVPGSARARNLEVERQQWVEFLGILGANPQIALSRELLRETASKFETLNERMLDEIHQAAIAMLQAKTQVAGHAGGGDNGGNPEASMSGPGGPGGASMSNLLGVAHGGAM